MTYTQIQNKDTHHMSPTAWRTHWLCVEGDLVPQSDGGNSLLWPLFNGRASLPSSDGIGCYRSSVCGLSVGVSGDGHTISNSISDNVLSGLRYCTAREQMVRELPLSSRHSRE